MVPAEAVLDQQIELMAALDEFVRAREEQKQKKMMNVAGQLNKETQASFSEDRVNRQLDEISLGLVDRSVQAASEKATKNLPTSEFKDEEMSMAEMMRLAEEERNAEQQVIEQLKRDPSHQTAIRDSQTN